MKTIEQITSAGIAERLAENGIPTLAQLVEADGQVVAALCDGVDVKGLGLWGVSTHTVHQWQAQARTELLADAPRTPKRYIAVHRLSIESIVPNFVVESGQMVDLWWKDDDELAMLEAIGAIAPLAGNAEQLVANVEWIPAPVKRRLFEGGLYTLGDLLGKPPAGMDGQERTLAEWLTGVAQPEAVAAWRESARIIVAQEA